MQFWDSAYFTYLILPALIFFSRMVDVSIGTLRIISVSRGFKNLAPIMGFFEVLIWIIVVGKVMQNLDNWLCYLAYAGGFSAGSFVGLYLEEKLALGLQMVRIISSENSKQLIQQLNHAGFGATSIAAHGSRGSVTIVYTIIKRRGLRKVTEIINQFNPKAFYSVEDVRSVRQGIFPVTSICRKRPGEVITTATMPKNDHIS